MKTLEQLQKEFGARVCALNTGAAGLRGGLHFDVKEVAGDAPLFDFIGSDGTLDRYNEVIKPEAWGDMKNFKANPVIPDCHDYSSITRILGRAISVEVRDGKLCNRVEFCLDNPFGQLAYKMTKGGFIKSQSVGFIPEEWVNGNGQDQPWRTYSKCELLEISLVVVPANPGATVGLALKSGAIQKKDLSAAADFLRGLAEVQSGTEISDNQPNPTSPGRAAVGGVTAAQLLERMRRLV